MCDCQNGWVSSAEFAFGSDWMIYFVSVIFKSHTVEGPVAQEERAAHLRRAGRQFNSGPGLHLYGGVAEWSKAGDS